MLFFPDNNHWFTNQTPTSFKQNLKDIKNLDRNVTHQKKEMQTINFCKALEEARVERKNLHVTKSDSLDHSYHVISYLISILPIVKL